MSALRLPIAGAPSLAQWLGPRAEAPPTRSRAALRRWIARNWEAIAERARRAGAGLASLASLPSVAHIELLGSSLKSEHTDSGGEILSRLLYLSPSSESGRLLCGWETRSCSRACLATKAGQMVMTPARNARLWRTALFFGARGAFFALLALEIDALRRRAEREGKLPAVRLDASSDLGLADMRPTRGEATLAEVFPDVTFYDYTKSPTRALAYARGELPENRHVTFSYSGENDAYTERVLTAGGQVAVVFRARPAIAGVRGADPLPERWRGWRVHDADLSDARWLDSAPIAGLRFKQARGWERAADAAGAFVQPCA